MSTHVHGFAATMAKAEVKAFDKADEVREFPKGRVELIKVGGATIGRAVFDPGVALGDIRTASREHESCEAPHFQYHVSGILRVKMDDGSEFDCKPGDVSVLPSGHDAWVIGNEPAIVVDFQGMVDYASAHTHVEGTTMLDGNSYHGQFIEKGKSSGDPDTLIFANGRFRSSACDQYGYGDAPYAAIADGETVHFNAETESPRYGKLVWKGKINGNQLKGEILMVQDGQAPIENFINATLVTNSAKE